ncbi:MAG: glycosyltransferase family 4 protein [Actinobacteria bacterium]|nr:MAG: glycosyltransferase family 4 protein [Actinomycetota bacterium]
MRVAIDVSPLVQTRAGTARYLKGLLRELRHRDGVEVSSRSFGRGDRLSTLVRDSVWYPFLVGRAEAADVLHCPTYRGPVRPPRVPLVVTVHDLAVLRHPGAFNRWTREYSPRVVPRVLRAAREVIAVSEFTRRELVELLGVSEEKIHVVPNAVEDEFTEDGPAEQGEYVLAVGTLEPRKNLARLVEAVRRTDTELRIVGARGWGRVEVDSNGVRWLGEVSDAELARLYRGAVCVAYPSLYEGFGIPVLEAMACGAPVVTTRGTAMEEVADGAAVLVDAQDPAEIAAGIFQAVADRAQLVARGLERAREFRWDAVAAATMDVYREAIA